MWLVCTIPREPSLVKVSSCTAQSACNDRESPWELLMCTLQWCSWLKSKVFIKEVLGWFCIIFFFLIIFLLSLPKLQQWEVAKAHTKTPKLQLYGNGRKFLIWADKSTDILLLGLWFQIQLILLLVFMSRLQTSCIDMPSMQSDQNTGRGLGVYHTIFLSEVVTSLTAFLCIFTGLWVSESEAWNNFFNLVLLSQWLEKCVLKLQNTLKNCMGL